MHPQPTQSPNFVPNVPGMAVGNMVQPPMNVVNAYPTDNMQATPASGSTGSPNGQDTLMEMSNMLMGQGFADLDRVIMSDGTDFSFNPFDFNVFDMPAGT